MRQSIALRIEDVSPIVHLLCHLEVKELRPVENDPYERCVGAFLDHCDDNADNVLSLDEWCDCFAWVGRGRSRFRHI